MTILIDKLQKIYGNCEQEINGYYYIAKPYDDMDGLKTRIQDAYKVLTGKSKIFHFKIDEEQANDK